MESAQGFIVTIDGPAGAGKSTVAKKLAQKLGFTHVDTGALYRLAALCALRESIEDQHLAQALDPSVMKLAPGGRVFLREEDVTDEIRALEVSRKASQIAQLGAVRGALLDLQRSLGRTADPGAVLEGRDIGTVVFPKAEVKVFLYASADARAKRRLEDIRAQGTSGATFSKVLGEIQERDTRDETRDLAPLVPADDAVEIDSTEFSAEQVVDRIALLCRQKMSAPSVPEI